MKNLTAETQKCGVIQITMKIVFVAALLLLVGCRSLPPESGIYRGHFTFGFEHSDFHPCDRNEMWWVSWEKGEKLADAAMAIKGITNATVYVEVQGDVSATGHYGHLNGYKREIVVRKILVVRSSSLGDCK